MRKPDHRCGPPGAFLRAPHGRQERDAFLRKGSAAQEERKALSAPIGNRVANVNANIFDTANEG